MILSYDPASPPFPFLASSTEQVKPNLFQRSVQGPGNGTTSTSNELASQWTAPDDVLSVLLIIGGDIVQTALAQTAGEISFFSPVCFSFGWVAYSFTALINVLGEGRLLPKPDYPVKVFNLASGYARENKNWLIGRIVRDHGRFFEKEARNLQPGPLGNSHAMRISIYDSLSADNRARRFGRVHFLGLLVVVLQLGIATIPVGTHGNWAILFVTGVGTALALMTGALPQWKIEKQSGRRGTTKRIALSTGNGSREIMIINGVGHGLDLEDLCTLDSPRQPRDWNAMSSIMGRLVLGRPVGFWMTTVSCAVQSIFWLALLITVAGLKSDMWYLLMVGAVGMFQNAVLAATNRAPSKRGVPLVLKDVIVNVKIMNALMDLETTFPGAGKHLLKEFFPGELRPKEVDWWAGRKDDYDRTRYQKSSKLDVPRSLSSEAIRQDSQRIVSGETEKNGDVI